MIKVFCVLDYYLPGYLGGGPITTIANMRKILEENVVFHIFTRDRDLGSRQTYPNIKKNKWNKTLDGLVYYATPEYFRARNILKLISEGNYDIIYLNSFFSIKGSILPLILLFGISNRPRVLLAPRGEFSLGALKLKWVKKYFFISIVRYFNLYRGVFWHASTTLEADDIRRTFPSADGFIFVAADPVLVELHDSVLPANKKTEGQLRMAFISRISPMKNIDGLLKILAKVSLPVRLDIYGPIEDKNYWMTCSKLIEELPKQVYVAMHGSVKQNSVSRIFAEYDLFAFPTHGENFGHVIFESLRVGTPVLVSDQTPWKQDEEGGLTVIPLHDEQGWRNAIELAAQRNNEAQKAIRCAARNYAVRYAKQANTEQENLNLFFNVLSY